MFKVVYCVAKKPGLSFEAFSLYWREQHGPLVRSYAAALRAKRYVQSHACQPNISKAMQGVRAMPAGYDGITEMWWESETDFQAALSHPEAIKAGQALIEDERHFIDMEKSTIFVTEEYEIFSY